MSKKTKNTASGSGPSLYEYGVDAEKIVDDAADLISNLADNFEQLSYDDWKDAYRSMNQIMMPMVAFSAKLTQAIQELGDAAEEQYGLATSELGELTQAMQELQGSFMTLAQHSGMAQQIEADAEFQQELRDTTLAAVQEING